MDIIKKITADIEPSLSAMGFSLVQVKMTDGMRRKTLSIMAERADEKPMGADDCAEISRTVGALLEVEDPISGAYDLEICSPGIDRPLTKLSDFSKYEGMEAKVETLAPLEGNRKRFRGKLAGVKKNEVSITMPEGPVVIAFDNIKNAKLVLTDELIAQHLKQHKRK